MIRLLAIPVLILLCAIWLRLSKKVILPLLSIAALGLTGVLTGSYMNIGFVAEHKLLLIILLAAIVICIIMIRFVNLVIIPVAALIILQSFGVISGIKALPELTESLLPIAAEQTAAEQSAPDSLLFELHEPQSGSVC